MILVVDNTQNKDQYFPKLLALLSGGYKLIRTQSDLDSVDVDVSGIILSGSPLMITEEHIRAHKDQFALNITCIRRYNVPVMAICFGAQLINVLFGGTLLELASPFCGDNIVNQEDMNFTARFCLHYVLEEVPSCFRILAFTNLMEHLVPCAIQHRQRKMYGYLFHPEYHPETQYLVTEFLKECARTSSMCVREGRS